MTKLKPGDRIEVRIKSDTIVSNYKEYDELRVFEIVAIDDGGYYIYIPHHIYLSGSTILDASTARKLKIEQRFDGEKFLHIAESMINNIKSEMDGMICARCKDFMKMAIANQSNGTFLCWSCRNDRWR